MAGLATAFGSGAMTNSIDEISRAKTILVIGSNTTVAHPVIALEIRQAVRAGAKLIVADPRHIELVDIAHLWLRLRPGTNVSLLGGMMRVIWDEGLVDRAFIEERGENFDAFRDSLAQFDLETVERITGVPADQVREAARLYAQNTPSSIVYAMGITQHTTGTDNVLALANLAMMTGNIGKPGAGVNPLRGHNNVQGACDMGCLPNVYTGYQPVTNAEVRAKMEAAWGVSLPEQPGLTLTEIFDAAYEGRIKAIYIMGENPVLSDPDAAHVAEALRRLDFLVVQDIFLTETAQLAHVVLPAATFAEKEGTFTNTERRVQLIHKAVEPPGEAKPDWWITGQIAQRLGGNGFDFESAAEVFDETVRVTPSYGGMSYTRLAQSYGLQWPCPTPEHPGTSILHIERFTRGRGLFTPISYRPPAELPNEEYPLMLTTGRLLFHFHTGTMTRKVKGLERLRPEERVELNPEDAERLGVQDREFIKVTSRRGQVVARAQVTDDTPPGVIFMTFHFWESATNLLTSPALDPVAKIPEFKVAAVRVEGTGRFERD